MTDTRDEKPLWRVREELRREAREHVDGRAAFERHVRPATKPLPPVEVHPPDMLRLLDALDEAERLKEQYHEQWMIAAGNRPEQEEGE